MAGRFDKVAGIWQPVEKRSDKVAAIWQPTKKRFDKAGDVWHQSYSSNIAWMYVATKGANPGLITLCTPEATNAFHFTFINNGTGKEITGYVDYTFPTPVNLPAGAAIVATATGAGTSEQPYAHFYISLNGGGVILSHSPNGVSVSSNLTTATSVSTLRITADTYNTSGSYIENLTLYPTDHNAFNLNSTGISN